MAFLLDTDVALHLRDGDEAVTAKVAALPVLAFDDTAADAYRQIVESAGYSRRKILDRMIAAQAIVHRATLVTRNAADFRDVPGLDLMVW